MYLLAANARKRAACATSSDYPLQRFDRLHVEGVQFRRTYERAFGDLVGDVQANSLVLNAHLPAL
jgi:hypothetical protein